MTIPEIPLTTVADVSPSVDAVAALERTRTAGDGTDEEPTFGPTTRPTAVEATALILQAAEGLLIQLPPRIHPDYYARVQHLVALYTAILIEGSYFREQLDSGSVDLWMKLLADGLKALQAALGWSVVPGGGEDSQTITSVRIGSVITDRDPFFDTYNLLPPA